MSEESEQLKARSEAFAIAVVKFCDGMPNSLAGRRIAQQLLDAGTSVAANYRAVCRAYTSPLFISKLAIVDEEADEKRALVSNNPTGRSQAGRGGQRFGTRSA
jgi:four helix bundle protein